MNDWESSWEKKSSLQGHRLFIHSPMTANPGIMIHLFAHSTNYLYINLSIHSSVLHVDTACDPAIDPDKENKFTIPNWILKLINHYQHEGVFKIPIECQGIGFWKSFDFGRHKFQFRSTNVTNIGVPLNLTRDL